MNETETAQNYPLSWPMGWRRTPYHARKRAPFYGTKTVYGSVRPDGSRSSYKQKESLTVGQGLERLTSELRRLSVTQVVISSNLRVKQDGLPYSQQAKSLDDPGIAVYFKLKGKPRVLACDRWLSAAENMAAIAGHIEAIRAQDRYGVGSIEQAFAGYAALPADSASDWRRVLGFAVGEKPNVDAIETRYKQLAREAHPDTANGNHENFIHLGRAKEYALSEMQETR